MRIPLLLALLLTGCYSVRSITTSASGSEPCGFETAGKRWSIELADGSQLDAWEIAVTETELVFRDEEGAVQSAPLGVVREVSSSSRPRGAIRGFVTLGVATSILPVVLLGGDSFLPLAEELKLMGIVGLAGGAVGLAVGAVLGDQQRCIMSAETDD